MTEYKVNIERTEYDSVLIEAISLKEAKEKAEEWIVRYNDNMLAEDDYYSWEIASIEEDDDEEEE